jgi:AcrR family transcriptional regulator
MRTRNGLVAAALTLLRSGASPTVTEVADAALVSPATAYRYFPNAQTLWIAVLEELGEPKAEDVFAGVEGAPLDTRVRALIERVGFRLFDDEAWRSASKCLRAPPGTSESASSTGGRAGGRAGGPRDRIPMRTGQRMRWIDDALAPYSDTLSQSARRMLRNGLALVIGVESVATLRDVCRLDVDECKRVSLWAGEALVRSALESSARDAKAKPRR